MDAKSATDTAALARRLGGLTPAERVLLATRLNAETSASAFPAGSPAVICPARPMRIDIEPTEGNADRRVAVYPASYGQQRMWFLDHYAADSPVYSNALAFQLLGLLNVAWLEMAFGQVIERHDTLRTTFAMEDGQLVQRVASHSGFRLQYVSVEEEIAADGRTAAAQRCVEEVACLPFDLAAEPALRAVLVRLKADQHVLLVVLHHIISDGWSRSNLWHELSEFYRALATGVPAAVPELPVQFAGYSAWQQRWLNGGALEEQTDYWKQKLAGRPEALDIPSDRLRPARESFRGSSCSLPLAPELMAALQRRAQEEGATLFMILLAAFKTLLHRYTGRDDLLVGVPIANRTRVETEGLIGFFANTLVMRTDLSGDPTFRELLRRVKETAVEAYANQDMPLEQLVELLQMPRDASRGTLFQVTFALQDYPEEVLRLEGIQSTPWPVATHTAKFDLGLYIERSAGGWIAMAEYSSDLFDVDRVKRMLTHWRVLLENVAARPGQRVSHIPLLTPVERRQLLIEWNDTAADYPRDKCIHDVFEQQAQETPDAVAVVFEDQQLTYRELNCRANQLAHYLLSLGVGPGVLVGVHLGRSAELTVALLGILKAGGVYLPLAMDHPAERLRFVLADSGARVALALRPSPDEFIDAPVEIVDLAKHAPLIQACSDQNPGQRVGAEDLAYVIYTSGSTGQPKGTAIPHRGVVRLVRSQSYAEFDSSQRFLMLAATSFDASTFELWGPLLNGASCVICREGLPDLAMLEQVVRRRRVTCLWLTAGLFNLIVDQRPAILGSVRHVLTGGEAASRAHVSKALKLFPALRLTNGYGPTESTTFACTYDIKSGTAFPSGSVPIGRPIANTRVYILDDRRQPVPIGVPGELYIGGDGLARGYLNRPDLTAERFVPDHFSAEQGARLYRTGDLCRYSPDGNIEFLGRMDHQVKIRGFRVELAEVESVLQDCNGVSQCAVVACREPSEDTRLVAYVVPAEPQSAPRTVELRNVLQQKIPAYMIPAQFEYLSELPLTPNGKLDRSALPQPTRIAPHGPKSETRPRNLLELELIRLWQRLFQCETIGREDNFFDLGGHSLLAARLAAEVEKLVGRPVPITAVFHAPTVATLACMLKCEDWVPPWSSLVPLQPMGLEPPVFCVHGWGGDTFGFVDLARELGPGRPVYGLQAVGLEGHEPRHRTVEEMAAHYVREIRSRRSEGPYHLVGHSLGGWIAYEVAQQLSRQGGRVGLLALLDTNATCDLPSIPYARVTAAFFAERIRFHLKQWKEVPPGGRLRHLGLRLSNYWHWQHITRARRSAPLPATQSGPTSAVSDYFDLAVARYRPRKYAGDVALFVADDAKDYQSLFWKHLILGRVQTHRVQGTHFTIIHKDYAKAFTSVFAQALHDAEVSAGSALVGAYT